MCLSERGVSPFLRWPGGKRWLLPEFRNLLDGLVVNRYFEPFLGGGAVFFQFSWSSAVISDLNCDLVDTYRCVRDDVEALIDRLRQISIDAKTYQAMRSLKPRGQIERAVRFLYLNRTAFAGIYRLNRQGDFNVPFGGGGRTTECLWRDRLLTSASEALKGVEVVCCDFEKSLRNAGFGDLVYCDPTYTTRRANGLFLRYNDRNFSWRDQERLSAVCEAAVERGATVIVSNASSSDLDDLYPSFSRLSLGRLNQLCPNPVKRGMVKETLFVKLSAGSVHEARMSQGSRRALGGSSEANRGS